jgi:hypothetical protein
VTTAERLTRLTFVRCSACGEMGTWGEEALCFDCATQCRGKATQDQRMTQWQHTLAELQVPMKYRDVPADMPLGLEYSMWRGKPAMLVLVGPTGTGKTWLGVRILGELYAKANMRGLFADAVGVVADARRLREQWQEGTMIEELCTARVLLLDDLAQVRMRTEDAVGRAGLDILAHVLRERDAWSRPTIITTNQPLEEWAKQEPMVLQPIVSRLAGDGLVRSLQGVDRRLA